MSTGSNINLSQAYISPTLQGIFDIAREYGNDIPSGGTLTWFTGSIDLRIGKQVYDIVTDSIIETGSFTSDKFTIRKIFHERTPAITRYLENSDYGLNEFGWNAYNMPGDYLLMPLHYDILRVQAVELNDQIRRSSYSFQITNNRLRLFPIPTEEIKLFFHYLINFYIY